MKRSPTKLVSTGDPQSELEIQRRIQWLREQVVLRGAVVTLPQSVIDRDPALQRMIGELDWLRVEE